MASSSTTRILPLAMHAPCNHDETYAWPSMSARAPAKAPSKVGCLNL